jgi:hypothetical protein
MITDRFLEVTKVRDETSAMAESLKAALQQRQNRVYCREEIGNERSSFRDELSRAIREECARYSRSVTDSEHCGAIRNISDEMSTRFGPILKDHRLRYGTSQKAFNLYLKFLWRMGKIQAPPPHCPVDSIVLNAGGIIGSWTQNDSEQEYMRWINALKEKANPLCLSEWEYEIWLRRAAG